MSPGPRVGRAAAAGEPWRELGRGFALLLGVKARLVMRSVLRRGGGWTALALAVMALVLAPVWLGLGGAATAAVRRFGTEGAVAVLGLVHFGWLFSAFLFAAFTEGFDLRMLLRYPIRPSTVFAVNVLLAPVDLVALFLVPPLGATVLAVGRASGAAAALGTAAAALFTILITGVALQILLALLGRFLRREWSRAVAGLVFGLAAATPAFLLDRAPVSSGPSAVLTSAVDHTIPRAARMARLAPTSALPALMVRGAGEGRPALLLAGGAGAILLLVAGVALGARWAAAAALAGDSAQRRGASRRVAPAAAGAASPRWERLLAPDLAVLLGRELRVWRRTPQILLGLLLTPLLVLFFFGQRSLPVQAQLFALPFICLVSIFNVSANQFGLDREGVRLLLLLPVEPRRLILAKNLAALLVVVAETALALIVVAALWRPPFTSLLAAGLSVLAVVPVVLVAGNVLSVRHPWRMTFRIGGTPPGALASALAQMVVVCAMAVLLAVPALAGHLGGGAPVVLGGTSVVGALAWLSWRLALPGAGRALVRRREHLLTTLAHPHETG